MYCILKERQEYNIKESAFSKLSCSVRRIKSRTEFSVGVYRETALSHCLCFVAQELCVVVTPPAKASSKMC